MSDPIRHTQGGKDPDQHPPPPKSGLSAFWSELKRRKVMRVAVTYAVVAWLED